MNIRDIDLNLLVFLDALLRERSVTKAALAMDISQPAMSNALRRLRKLLGDPVLVRTASGMQPTDRALKLQRPVRNALAQLETAIAPNRAFEPATAERLFTVLITDYAASVLMPHVVSVLEREAPNIALNILSAGSDAIDQIERGEADFLVNRFGKLPANFHQHKLWSDRMACLIRKDHPALVEADGDDRVADLHIWRVGPSHLAAILSVVTHELKSPTHYKALLAERSDLVHLTVEVQLCTDEKVA